MRTDLNIINNPILVNGKENPINPTLNEKSIEEKEFGIGATIDNCDTGRDPGGGKPPHIGCSGGGSASMGLEEDIIL